MGLKGAAIASTLSQFASFFYLIYSAINQILKYSMKTEKFATSVSVSQNMNNNNNILPRKPSNLPINNNNDNNINNGSTNSYYGNMNSNINSNNNISSKLSNVAILYNYIRIPTFYDITKFAAFSGPLFFVLLAKSFLWSFTTYAASTSGAASLAAHQITINFFLFFAIFGDVMSQLSQTYLPSTIYNMIQSQTNLGIVVSNSDTNKSIDNKSESKLISTDIAVSNNNKDTTNIDTTITTTNKDNTINSMKSLKFTYKHSYNKYHEVFLKTFTKITIIGLYIGVINSIIGYLLQTAGSTVCIDNM